jgi:hypothetical protein
VVRKARQGKQTELLQTTSFRFFQGRLRPLEALHVTRIAGMALLTLHADCIGFSARNRQKAFQANRIDRPVSVLTVTVLLANLGGGQHTGTVPLSHGTEKLGKLIGLALEDHILPHNCGHKAPCRT